MSAIRVLVVDDHPIVRQGVRSLLSAFPDIEVVSEAETPMAALAQLNTLRPDVVLLDVRLGEASGVEVARQVRRTHPDSRVIILTTYDDDEYLFGALQAGAHAYLLKDMALDELPAVIRAVHAGQRLLSPLLVDQVLAQFQQLAEAKLLQEAGLTLQERQLLKLMADGLTNRDIAAHLNFSEITVKKKVQDILEKLGVANRTQAVALAIRRGLI
ncbi:MAG: response regulator transcription factor [Anaerolineae bacterium]|jgi:two-component system response regulator DevR